MSPEKFIEKNKEDLLKYLKKQKDATLSRAEFVRLQQIIEDLEALFEPPDDTDTGFLGQDYF